MPVLKNARHERFAQAVAKGMSAAAAFAAAGFCPNPQNAGRLTKNETVRNRITELQTKASERTVVTVESLTKEFEEARALAIQKGQISAAVQATTGKAKLAGLMIDTRRHTGPNGGPIEINLSGIPDDKLDAIEAALTTLAGTTGGAPETGQG